MSHFSYAPLFQGPHFSTGMQESNIFLNNLLIDIFFCLMTLKKNRIESRMQIVLLREKQFLAKMHVQAERLYFVFAFCARHYPW